MPPQQNIAPAPLAPLSQKTHKAVIAAVSLGVLLVASLIFGYSTYQSRQDYKNNSDKKVATAVASAKTVAAAAQKATDDQAAKAPYKTYTGPTTYGSVSFSYPKTWSAYIDQTSSSEPINGYFYPDVVPGIQSNIAFSLRVELLSTAYSDAITGLQSNVENGTLRASAYIPPKMKGVANVQPGTIFTGDISNDSNSTPGTLVVIKVRDKTLEIYTESNANFAADFNNVILPSLSFSP